MRRVVDGTLVKKKVKMTVKVKKRKAKVKKR